MKIHYRLSLEYLSIEKVAKVDSRLAKPIRKPKIVPTGGTKTFLRAKGTINSSSLLKVWKSDQKTLNEAVKAQFLRNCPQFFAVYITMSLKSNYQNRLVNLFGLKLLKL